MGIASHKRRLSRLEAATGATKAEPLVFRLHEWAKGGPIRKGINDDDETIARMEAEALDRLVAAGEISDEDRDCVQFVVRIIVAPSRTGKDCEVPPQT
jgi:hypothetical protein